MPHPHADEPPRAVSVHVVTVSTSRADGATVEDRSGAAVRELLLGAGHVVHGHDLVADDPEAIGALLDALLRDARVHAIVLTGGTGVSARDCTPEVLRARLDRELPGFGELFRFLSYAEIGPAAMLSTALGGIARGRPCFALPGSTHACRMAMETLILPELGHLVGQIEKEPPLAPRTRPAAGPHASAERPLSAATPLSPPHEGVVVTPMPGATPPPAPEPAANSWLARLHARGGVLLDVCTPELPAALERMAAARDVLLSAGVCRRARVGEAEYLAFGFPDLDRPASRVLLVRDAWPHPEVVALHRESTGVVVEASPLLHAHALDGEARSRTGRPVPEVATLFALEGRAVWADVKGRMQRWNGRTLAEPVSMASAYGTLLLDWSQR